MQITSSTNIETYDNSNRTSNAEKTKSDNFESLISSSTSSDKKSSAIKEEKEIVVKSSTQSLYEDIISLLRTGFTVGELKAFEERLKEILKMKEDKESGKDISIKDIEAALKQLEMEILEAKKNRTGEVIKKASENTTSSSNPSSDFDITIGNITNMLQEIKNSSNNTKQNSDDNEEYDRLRLLLKMS